MSIKVFVKPSLSKFEKDPSRLFEFCVKTVIFTKREKQFLQHNQLASLIFGNGNQDGQKLLSIVSDRFKRYIEHENKYSHKYRFKIGQIEVDFPSLSDKPSISARDKLLEDIINGKEPEPYVDTEKSTIEEVIKAIDSEIAAAIQDKKNHTYFVLSHRQVDSKTTKGIYDLLLDIESDEYVKVYEGMPAELRFGAKEIGVEILDFDNLTNILTIHTDLPINSLFLSNKCYVVLDTTWMLRAIKERLEAYEYPQNFPITKLLKKSYSPTRITNKIENNYYGVLDDDQILAVKTSIQNDITLIWGPPGTGKSFTIAHYLLNSMLRNERTIVCCIANAAVDSITNATIKIIKQYNTKHKIDYQNGKILRVGYTRDPKLISETYLSPNSPRANQLIVSIEEINKRISSITNRDKVNELKSKRSDLKKEYAEEVKRIISGASLVFCTASKMHTDSVFEQLQYDNIVIDEASMMSVPHFIALSNNISKRIVIAGDFRQLGPVVLSNSAMSQKWLFQDLFEFAGLKHKTRNMSHKGLVQIKSQRRFCHEICQLINNALYNGELKSIEGEEQRRLIPYEPDTNRAISYHDLSSKAGFICVSKNNSRRNDYSAIYITDILLEPLQRHPLINRIEIGIITPYRSQVNKLNTLISEKPWPKSFKDKIKVGTVHSFQGSEADLLIYDLVESKDLNVGRLYCHDTGKRLVNVAISRAKSKLIVVGDIDAILNNKGSNNVEREVAEMMRNIKRFVKATD